MKSKRFTFLAVVILLILSVAAGCSQSSNNATPENTTGNTTGSSTSGSSTSQEANKGTESTPEALPDGKLSPEPIKLIYATNVYTPQPLDSEPAQRIRKAILEKTNIDLQLEATLNSPGSDYNLNLMLASGQKFDLLFNSYLNPSKAQEIPRLVKEGILIPLDDLLEEYAPDILRNIEPSTWEFMKYEGKIYGLPGQATWSHALQYRKDWLDEAGLKVPTTIEEFENVARVFKEKFDNPGYTQGWDTLDFYFSGSYVPTPDGRYLDDADGKIKPSYVHPNYKLFLAKMADWYQKGYLNKEAATMNYDQWLSLNNSAKLGMVHAWTNPTPQEEQMKQADPDAEIIWGPALDSEVQKGVLPSFARAGDFIGITKWNQHPEITVKLANWASATPEGYELTMMGEEGYDWILKKREGDNVLFVPNADISQEKRITDMYHFVWQDKMYTKYHAGEKISTYYEDVNSFAHAEIPDLGVIYDVNTMKSKDQKGDLDKYIKEEKWKFIMGTQSAGSWDEVINKWMEMGGSQYIDDMTEQYRTQRGL